MHACLGPDALTTTVFREPRLATPTPNPSPSPKPNPGPDPTLTLTLTLTSARTVSAYFYYACGTARTAEQLAAELARPEVTSP